MKVKAHLKPHTGIQDTEVGRVPYTHPDQWMVHITSDEMVGEMFVGYLIKKKGGAFLPTTTFVEQSLGLRDLIHEAVSEAAGDHRPLGIVPLHPDMLLKRMSDNPEPDEDDEPDDTETEE
jgi:hypothetical protein